ncbi:hypothetical transcript [Echinococcus multilocularis]|uniref:Hypothetical transcript n=1 Tax=Echinococcus multilocularis TaxID=6211 RepID=A0A068Y1A2_ECHMU|nr:hypothetical transcript [Echinococcus multilocularis]
MVPRCFFGGRLLAQLLDVWRGSSKCTWESGTKCIMWCSHSLLCECAKNVHIVEAVAMAKYVSRGAVWCGVVWRGDPCVCDVAGRKEQATMPMHEECGYMYGETGQILSAYNYLISPRIPAPQDLIGLYYEDGACTTVDAHTFGRAGSLKYECLEECSKCPRTV